MASPELELPDLPHPAGVLADPGYNPLDHLLDTFNTPFGINDSIAAIPGYPDALLRWFPTPRKLNRAYALLDQFGSPLDEDRMWLVAEEQERNLELMRGSGIAVVDNITWVGPINPELGIGPDKTGRATIYSTVRKLEGRDLTASDPEWHKLLPNIQDLLGRFGAQELCLWDIGPEQYTLVTSEAERQAIFHDIEPLFRKREDIHL